MEQEVEGMPIKEKENTTNNSEETGLSTSAPKAHYDAVKMKYFASLGMGKPPEGSNRERGKTDPSSLKYLELTKDLSQQDKEFLRQGNGLTIATNRKRSKSTPLDISKGIPIKGRSDDAMFSFDEDESGEEGSTSEEETAARSVKFIPPHEMIAKEKSFEVGTARSLAVWEQQRRKKMNDISMT